MSGWSNIKNVRTVVQTGTKHFGSVVFTDYTKSVDYLNRTILTHTPNEILGEKAHSLKLLLNTLQYNIMKLNYALTVSKEMSHNRGYTKSTSKEI
jgi:hypothetical protein